MATAELGREATNMVAFTIQPIDFATTKAEIEKVTSGALLLRVADASDKTGLEKCHQTRMQLRTMRTTIEAKRKSMKASALEYGRCVDSAAKELLVPIEKAEAHLVEQENIVKHEQERLLREAEEKRLAVIRERLRLLQQCGKAYLAEDVAMLSAVDFDALLTTERADKQRRDETAEQEVAEQRKVAEMQKTEADRLAAENARLEKVRLEQEAEQRRIDTEKRRLAWEEAERKRQAELEKARAEAAVKARLDAIAEQERRAAAARTKAEAEARERHRAEALRPDHEKLLAVADAVQAIAVPAVSREATPTARAIAGLLKATAEKIVDAANRLVKVES